MFVEVERDVTVTVTTQTCPTGVPVIVKSFDAFVLLTEVEKKLLELPSGAAATAIETPLAGIAEVMSTFRLKGPTPGVTVVFTAGLVVTANVASGELLLLPPQAGIIKAKAIARIATMIFPVNVCLVIKKFVCRI